MNEADTRQTAGDSQPSLMAGMALDASSLMPARVVEGEERALMVRKAVEALGERQRMALMLSRFENMSYVEIAEAMGLTSKAVKSNTGAPRPCSGSTHSGSSGSLASQSTWLLPTPDRRVVR